MKCDQINESRNSQEFDTLQETKRKSEFSDVGYDDLLLSAGEIGRYQVLLFFSTFPFYLYGVFVYYSQLFMTEASSNHWCWIPELENFTNLERRNLSIPSENNRYGYSRCRAYVANWSEVLSTGIRPNDTWSTAPCQHGWEFDDTQIPYPTITSEMEWVCERDSYQATAQAFYFVGSVVGCLPIGWIADKYGRVPAAVVSNLIACLGGVLSVFVRDFKEFVICRFIVGFAGERCMLIVYLLVLEYVAPKYRPLIANLSFGLFISVPAMAIPWIAIACGNWKIFGVATSLPMALVVLTPFVIPESPRWLLSQGRVDDAVNKVLNIAKVNNKEIPPTMIEDFKQSELNKNSEGNLSWIELLKRPKLRIMLFCMCLEYMSCTLVYDSLVRTIGQMDLDFFVLFTIMGFTELPSLVILALTLDWIGRRLTVTATLGISAIFSIISAVVAGGWPSITCVVIARFCANMAYGTSDLWSSELMPTPVRASGSSLVCICGYFSMIFGPYVAYLETYAHWLPMVLVGCVSAIGAITASTLPETANKKLPQTFLHAEELIVNNKFMSAPFLSKKQDEKCAEPMLSLKRDQVDKDNS